jgi:hypothetical protein
MAINGNNPLILVQKYNNIITSGETNNVNNIKVEALSLVDSLKKWQNIKDIKQIKNGMPIPFILHQITGFISVQESVKLSANLNYEEGVKIQDKRQNSLEIALKAKKDNPIVLAFVFLIQSLWQDMETYNYDISYFNDGLFIKQGHIGSLSIENEPGQDIYNISITLDSGKTFVSKFIEEKEEKENPKNKNYIYDNDPLSKAIKNIKP